MPDGSLGENGSDRSQEVELETVEMMEAAGSSWRPRLGLLPE